MTAFSTVRFKVKPGREDGFLDAHRALDWPGLVRASIIATGGQGYCLIAEWPDAETIAAARPAMIATLDGFRDTLEPVGMARG